MLIGLAKQILHQEIPNIQHGRNSIRYPVSDGKNDNAADYMDWSFPNVTTGLLPMHLLSVNGMVCCRGRGRECVRSPKNDL